MTQVVDASAVVGAWVDEGPCGQWCVARLAEDDVAAPALMPFEVANIVRRLSAHGESDASTAAQAIADLRGLPADLLSFESLADRIWELRANLTVYDASYVALAEVLDARLVTLDRRLSTAPGVRCEVVVPPPAPPEAE